MTNYKTNRPWFQSFHGAVWQAKQDGNNQTVRNSGLSQVHKLARNYIASLDLGDSPNMQVVNHVDSDVRTATMTSKEKYLEWVRNWKKFYLELSELIRVYKKQDRTELFRLKETAQVMLNARRIGKLASWAVVQKTKRLNAT